MTLRAPPKPANGTASLIGRFIGLLILLAGFAVVVWAAATNQQVGVVEQSNPLLNPPGEHVGVGDLSVHVRTFGSGDAHMVLVHDDSMAGGALLEETAQSLADEGRHVIVPDLVGFGLSSRVTEPGRVYSSIGQAETLGRLLDGMEVDQAEVVGFGGGGGIAADLTVTRPDLVTRLVLVDTAELTMPSTGWHSLEAIPFGLGQAVSYTREGGSARAEETFLSDCPGPADCNDPAILEAFRRVVTVPDTAASIRARRASSAASVAGDRLDEIEVGVVVLSTSSITDVGELAGRFGVTAEVVGGGAGLVAAIAGG